MQNPGPTHWEALEHIIIHLRSIKDLGLTFGRQSKPTAEGFCDAGWGGQKHHHSISGYSFHMEAGKSGDKTKFDHIFSG